MSFQMINLHTNLHYIIANLLPSWHLHFGTGLKMYCKSDFSSCELYYPWLPDCRVQVRVAPEIFGENFLVPLGSAPLFKQLKLKSAPNL